MVDYPRVILGLWPIAGVTSVAVEEQSLATIHEAWNLGVRWFDTAYSYGYSGESDRLLKRALGERISSAHIIGKVGQRWGSDRTRLVDGSPDTLKRDAEESLVRCGSNRFELLLLHQPDPKVPIEVSATALRQLQEQGVAKAIGICNASQSELERFSTVAPVAATQFGCNLLQQTSSEAVRQWCEVQRCAGLAYWVLMKGFLAGKIGRDHHFPEGDSRPRYPIFQPPQREATHRLIDGLRPIAEALNCSVGPLVIARTLMLNGIRSAIVGALRPEQIRESLSALQLSLPSEIVAKIDELIAQWHRFVSDFKDPSR